MPSMTSTEISAGTRERILDAAWARVRDGGAAAASVKAIAADAGVSRQLVYFHYRNRAGLLLAMARHRDRASGFAGRVRATGQLPPVEALEALLRAWCDYLPELTPVARALEAALIAGDEGGEAWTDRMGDLHAVLGAAADRVARAGRLAPGWTPAAAADWLWSRVQPGTWDHLVAHRHWSHAAYTDRTVATLLAELVVPAGRRAGSGRPQ
jgi:AcrR family transcriptional regulator